MNDSDVDGEDEARERLTPEQCVGTVSVMGQQEIKDAEAGVEGKGAVVWYKDKVLAVEVQGEEDGGGEKEEGQLCGGELVVEFALSLLVSTNAVSTV